MELIVPEPSATGRRNQPGAARKLSGGGLFFICEFGACQAPVALLLFSLVNYLTVKKMAPVKGPSSILLVVVMMATMLNHDHALGAMIAPVSIMVSVTTHFDTHTGPVMAAITMHFAPVPVTVVAITANSDAHVFGACKGRSDNGDSC
jgi:hypothetical protein